MNDAAAHIADRDRVMTSDGERVERAGRVLMRIALGIVFLWFGAMKFTSYEAGVIAPFIANSPLVAWLHGTMGIQGASNLIGIIELVTGALLLAGAFRPALSLIGGALGALTFLVTLSFLFTTPGVGEPLAGGFPALSAVPGQFLLKDLGLLGVSLFFLGEGIWRRRAGAPGDKVWPSLRLRDRHHADAAVFRIGVAVMRYGLALIFLWFGAMKFTSYEATGVAPFIANSPIVGWWHAILGIQGASYMLGVFEIATGMLLVLYRVAPRASVIGGVMAVLTFLITVSFLFTTPGVAAPVGFPVLSGAPGQFLLKDIGLLSISICLLGESIALASFRSPAATRSPVAAAPLRQ